MSILNTLLLTGSISFADQRLPFIFDPIEPNYEMLATRTIAKALYRQSDLDEVVKKAEKRYLPKPVRKYGAIAGVIIKVSYEQRVSWEWTF